MTPQKNEAARKRPRQRIRRSALCLPAGSKGGLSGGDTPRQKPLSLAHKCHFLSRHCRTLQAVLSRYPFPDGYPERRAMRLTVKGIEALEPGDKRREIPDSLMMGLYLIVQPGTGNKAWAVRCRQNGRQRKITIGRYPVYGLAEAREAAARILRSVSEGRDPGRPNAGSVEATVAQFMERHARRKYRPSTLRECTRTMERARAAWRGRRLDSITKGDVRDLLDGIGAPAASNQALKFLKKLFAFAAAEDLLKASPINGLARPHPERSRDRILTRRRIAARLVCGQRGRLCVRGFRQGGHLDRPEARRGVGHAAGRAAWRHMDTAGHADEE